MSAERPRQPALPVSASRAATQKRSKEDAERLKTSKSLRFGLAILRHYRPYHLSAALADIAAALDRPRPTTHRYMATLIALGMVEQRDARNYSLTAKAADVGLAALRSTGLRDAVHEDLVGLRRRTGCTSRIGVLLDLDVLLVDQARSSGKGQALHALNTRPGALLPGHFTALGKALLADVEVGALPEGLRARARRRSGSLDRARLAGYAVEDEEHEPGVCAISAPVRDAEGRTIAAIDILGCAPQIVLPRLVERHSGELIQTAQRIGKLIECRQLEAKKAARRRRRRQSSDRPAPDMQR